MKAFLQKIRNPFSPGSGRFVLLLLLIAVSLHASALTFEYEGIKYETLSSDGEVQIGLNNSVSGDIVIPETVQYEGATYRVTDICQRAFEDCTSLTSIKLPEGVTIIAPWAFYGCTGLTSISLPKDLIDIGLSAFSECKSLASIKLPEGVKWIRNYAFTDCTALTSIILPESITEIGSSAFQGCTGLTSVNLPEGLTRIEGYTFYNCTGLKSLTIPENVTSIGVKAFYGCILKPLKILSKQVTIKTYGSDNALSGLSGEIVCYDANYEDIKTYIKRSTCKVYTFDNPIVLNVVKEYLCGVSFTVGNPYYEGEDVNESYFAEISAAGIKDVPVSTESINLIKGLSVNSNYILRIYYYSGTEKKYLWNQQLSFNTETPERVLEYYCSSTQTTLTLKSITGGDETCKPVFTLGGKRYSGKPITITGLRPRQSIYVEADFNGYIVRQANYTKDINVYVPSSAPYPNALECVCNYDVGDAKLQKVEWKLNNETLSTTKKLTLTGLIPEKEYAVSFTVTVDCADGSTYTKSSSKTFKTAPLELKILNPKSVGNGKTIVSAETNISESEVNVGFEWKKTDAPVTLPYSRGYSAICDGHLEGLIQNLQSTYYNVRAFYRDANDKYYYSDLVSFDPTDFSFFEPTVHTYPAESEENRATLHGYVLGGTDRILGQGFHYWIVPADIQSSEAMTLSADSDIMTVEADGQRMTAVISGLKPGTTYGYRAYVETESGMKYGEEQTFVTPGEAGVEDVAVDEAEVTVVGYFDLYGHRYEEPREGFNIVLYSNGTTRKIINK